MSLPSRLLVITDRKAAALPLEEVLFFVVVPLASVLTLEAVRSARPHWPAGDEAPARDGEGDQDADRPGERR